MNRKVLIAGIVIMLPLLVILFVSLGRNPNKIDSPLVGRTAPAFALRQVGTPELVSFESLRGKPAVVNFWATWCVPCYEEHGVLVDGARRMGSDVQFLGIVFDDEESRIQQFLAQNGSAYPTLLDSSGKTAIAYGVYGVPETFFIDASGTIVAKHDGPLSPQLLAMNIQKAKGVVQ